MLQTMLIFHLFGMICAAGYMVEAKDGYRGYAWWVIPTIILLGWFSVGATIGSQEKKP
jgi:hypothetical protein